MAGSKNRKKSRKQVMRGRRKAAGPAILIALMLALGGLLGFAGSGARIAHLKHADLYLEDLPPSFDGTTILYISDINIRNANDSAAVMRLMDKLQDLDTDILMLGGDYSSATLMESLNGISGGNTDKAKDFILSLSDFNAPLGKFAVAGENDDFAALEPLFAASGVELLGDRCVQVQKGKDEIIIAGLQDVSGGKTHYEQIGAYFSGDECVLTMAHNPAAYVGVRVAEASGGGAWADAVFSGHTLGGQIRIGDRTLRNLPEAEKRCIAGWYYTDDLPMLVSQGLGCRGAMLRLGSQSEIWMITLHQSGIYLPE